MADDMGDKTEDPTGRRLSEARNQGNVAKSQDLAAAIELTGAFILLLIFGAAMARARPCRRCASVTPAEPDPTVPSTVAAPRPRAHRQPSKTARSASR